MYVGIHRYVCGLGVLHYSTVHSWYMNGYFHVQCAMHSTCSCHTLNLHTVGTEHVHCKTLIIVCGI